MFFSQKEIAKASRAQTILIVKVDWEVAIWMAWFLGRPRQPVWSRPTFRESNGKWSLANFSSLGVQTGLWRFRFCKSSIQTLSLCIATLRTPLHSRSLHVLNHVSWSPPHTSWRRRSITIAHVTEMLHVSHKRSDTTDLLYPLHSALHKLSLTLTSLHMAVSESSRRLCWWHFATRGCVQPPKDAAVTLDLPIRCSGLRSVKHGAVLA